MAKLTRVTGKVFGGSAPLDEIGQFGSALAGDPTNTQDVATIQALPAYSEGWGSAVVSSLNFPPIEEVTGVLKTISYQSCYLLQEGIPEYDANTNYSNTSIVKSVNGDELIFYLSQTNDNLGNPLNDTDHWARAIVGGRASFLGQIITSTIPLTDGSLLAYGSYKAFIDYIANLYNSGNYPSLFTTEADWQTSVTTYGVCGKFVYDSVNDTVRLPKITGFTESTITPSTVGNLTEAGLPNITGTATGTEFPGGMTTTGAFNSGGSSSYTSAATGSGSAKILGFDAHRSNDIYGNSNTVQPQSIKVLYYIVIGTTTKTDIQVDIDEIATDLNGKADVDLSNISASQSAKNSIVAWGMPDYANGISLVGLTTYTCPSDGIINCIGVVGTAGSRLININSVLTGAYGSGTSTASSCHILVNKNDVMTSSTALYGTAYFYPLKGVN